MNFKKYNLQQSMFLLGLLFLFSCTNTTDQPIVPSGQVKTIDQKLSGPFPFYKDISVRPGLNFEVLSWGKGVDSIGGYLVLMSDSTKNNYKSESSEREGIITDAWNMDLDNDGNPEIYVELRSKKNVSDLNVYEYSGNAFHKITFPGLSSSMKKNYAGNDKFMIKNGDLFRSFPVVNSTDSVKKSGATKLLQYKLSGNSFSASEVKE